MLEDQINLSYFATRLEKFYKDTIGFYNCGYDQGPFIPYTMPKYKEASLKIMYVGRDTYYWSQYVELENAIQSGNLEAYFQSNVNNIDVEKMMMWGNRTTAFWSTVMKLHLLLRTGEYWDDITEIGVKEKNILSEIGYDNLYSIETRNTLLNKGEWDGIINHRDYRKIMQAGEYFEGLNTIIEAYKPDFVIVLSWEEHKFVDEIRTTWLESTSVKGLIEVSDIPERTTKLIWTRHPRQYPFLRVNQKEMVINIAEVFKKNTMVSKRLRDYVLI